MDFFGNSEFIEYLVTKKLSHIRPNWELSWDNNKNCYEFEEDSYAEDLNNLIYEIELILVPVSYHDNEDCLCEYLRDVRGWAIYKDNNRWKYDDYNLLLEQGSFSYDGVKHLIIAIAGRVYEAKKHGQKHFDEMECGHQRILGSAIATVLYQRS